MSPRFATAVGVVVSAVLLAGCGSESAAPVSEPSPTLSPSPTANVVKASTFTMTQLKFSLPEGWKIDKPLSAEGPTLWIKSPKRFTGSGGVSEFAPKAETLEQMKARYVEDAETIAQGYRDHKVSVLPDLTVAGVPAFRISTASPVLHGEVIGFRTPKATVVARFSLATSSNDDPAEEVRHLEELTRMFIATTSMLSAY